MGSGLQSEFQNARFAEQHAREEAWRCEQSAHNLQHSNSELTLRLSRAETMLSDAVKDAETVESNLWTEIHNCQFQQEECATSLALQEMHQESEIRHVELLYLNKTEVLEEICQDEETAA